MVSALSQPHRGQQAQRAEQTPEETNGHDVTDRGRVIAICILPFLI